MSNLQKNKIHSGLMALGGGERCLRMQQKGSDFSVRVFIARTEF